jgi:hypothetical protein
MLMVGFALPTAVFVAAIGVVLLVNSVWLPGLGLLVGGAVGGIAAVKVLRKGSGKR